MLSTNVSTSLATSGLANGPAKSPVSLKAAAGDASVENARDLKQAFTQFVGETFFGQMLKSMRATVGEPAYFHGGMAEEQFQAQLDQHLAQDMASAGAGGFADSLFRSQFPQEAALLDAEAKPAGDNGLAALDALRRR